MLYQLPNGEVIFLSIEEYLNMTDEDLSRIVALGIGEEAPSLRNSNKDNKSKIDDHDERIDYTIDENE